MIVAMPIYVWPCGMLKMQTRSVRLFDQSLFALCQRMAATLDACDGIAGADVLAAPQIGDVRRVVMVRCHERGQDMRRTMINPVVLEEDKANYDAAEHDLSFPAMAVKVTRPTHALIEYATPSGERVKWHAGGGEARAALRGIELLDGRSLYEKATMLKRLQIRRRAKRYKAARFPSRVDHLNKLAAPTLLDAGEEE